jgi:hypothetical protein
MVVQNKFPPCVGRAIAEEVSRLASYRGGIGSRPVLVM